LRPPRGSFTMMHLLGNDEERLRDCRAASRTGSMARQQNSWRPRLPGTIASREHKCSTELEATRAGR
jgi:hypothetical protein